MNHVVMHWSKNKQSNQNTQLILLLGPKQCRNFEHVCQQNAVYNLVVIHVSFIIIVTKCSFFQNSLPPVYNISEIKHFMALIRLMLNVYFNLATCTILIFVVKDHQTLLWNDLCVKCADALMNTIVVWNVFLRSMTNMTYIMHKYDILRTARNLSCHRIMFQ